ncbi:MAG: A/G-specific adenine glycosylase [Deltaproteobacteria bacterium]|nr:A/G-specific adenine glycosylase [Deltaproteobacteria bacterium]
MSGADRSGPVPSPRRRALRRRLLAWYDRSRRDLPWRAPQGQADPYRAWLAEVMLQQTRVAAAIPYYTRFLARFPTLASLAAAGEEEVLGLWAGLGYYARGRNLLAAAREAQARHRGLPGTFEALRALPGFGPYTAGAVASIAFGRPVPAVDGNAARVLARLFLVEGRPEEKPVRHRIAALAAALVDPDRPGDWNQALMELGATHCGRAPACARCPAAALCEARRAGRERSVPPPRKRPRVERLTLACAAVRRNGRLLLARRASRGLLGGLWELPSAVVADGEEPRAALVRGLRERGLRASVGAEVAAVERALTHRRLTLVAHACRLRAEPPGGTALRWATAGEAARLGLSTAMLRLVERL